MAFINLNRLLDENADQGEVMAQKALADSGAGAALTGAETSIGRLQGGMNNGAEAEDRVAQAQAKANMLNTTGGMAAAGGGPKNALDAALMGQSNTMQQYRQRTGNLGKMLGDTEGALERKRAAEQNYAASTAESSRRFAERQQAEQERQRKENEKWVQANTQGYSDANNPYQGGYEPKTPEDYARYSDYVQKGRR